MSYNHTFATQSGDVPAAQLDENFNAAGNMGYFKCTATGSNSITLTPETNQPDIGMYTDLLGVKFIAPSAPTGLVQIQIGSLPLENLYDVNGNQCTAGSFADGAVITASYNLGLGGFQLDGDMSSQEASTIPFGLINGFLANSIAGTNTTGTLTVGAGQAVNSANTGYLQKNTSTNWAVANGNNINGYQGGATLPVSATIHFFMCQGTSGIGVFASNSLNPTLPAGYNTTFRRIFSLRTDSSGALLPGAMIQGQGGSAIFTFTANKADISATSGTSRVLAALPSVPTDVKMLVHGRALQSTTTGSITLWSGGDDPDAAPSTSGSPGYTTVSGTSIGSGAADVYLLTNTTAQLGYRSNVGSIPVSFTTISYQDFRN